MRNAFRSVLTLLTFAVVVEGVAADELTERQKRVLQILQQEQVEPVSEKAGAAGGLTDRQRRVREVLQQDQRQRQESIASTPPAQHPPLMCAQDTYAIRESGRKITVHDADGLRAAMGEANAGDVVELAAGEYGWITLNDLHYSDFVKLQGTEGAKIKHLGLTNVENLQIENVHFEYGARGDENWKPKVLEMKNIQNVRIIDSTFVGNKDTKTWLGDIPSVGIRAYGNSRNVVISGSRFSHIMRGVIFQQVDGYTIENNSLIDMGCDGLFFQNSSNGVIESNYLSTFRPFIYAEQGKTCHADFIQFDAGKGRNTITPSSNVTIRGNVMLQGEGGSSCSGIGSVCGAVQGIFLGGATGIHPKTGQQHTFSDILISDNVYCASGRNGISVANGKNVSIVNNAHYTCPPPRGENHVSRIVLRGTPINSRISGNTEIRVSNQNQALDDARTKANLNNCILKNL